MRQCDAHTGDLSVPPCDAKVVYVCGCSRCGTHEEIDGETFYACAEHREEAAGRHRLIYEREPKWYMEAG